MYSLFCEAKFWTLKNDIQVKNTDLGVLRYFDKKEIDDCPYLEGKNSYCTQRGTTFVLKNKRPLKLRDRLKELEQQLSSNKIVFYEWKDDNVVHLILNTGLIVAIGVNVHSKDIYKIMFDKFLIGKLLSENICDVFSTPMHLVISYNENQLTLVSFGKPLTKFNPPEKLSKLEPKIQHVDLCGPSGRRLERKLSCNKSGDTILTWWHSTRNEVYPWSPLVKDEDRANVHVYSLTGVRIELVCFYRTEFDLVNVSFSRIKSNAVRLIEQKVSKKGDVTVEYSSYEILKKVFKRITVTSIPLQTQICCHCVSPDEERLVLGCIDGSLILFDEPRGVTRLVKCGFIPNLVTWHNDGSLILIANEKNQFQFFDLALSCVRTQILSDDVNPSNLLDLASYFKTQPLLLHAKWNKKASATYYSDRFIPNDHLLLLIYEGGPVGVLSLIGGGGLAHDVQNSGLTPDTLIRQYLLWNQPDKALNVLLCLNWNTNGSMCLAGLYHFANHVFRHPFTPEGEIQLESALGSFYAPIRPLSRNAEHEFGDQVYDLTRRFFHLLLRHQLYEKAYCLAIDLCNADLFADLYHCARILEDEEMAIACRAKIEELNSASETSSCSHSCCSCSEEEDEEEGILPPLPQVSVKKSKASRVPPLPDLNRHNKLRGSSFFNQTYLQNEPTNGYVSQSASTSFDYPTLDYYSTTQILTPEFPHSYEIRTSFSGQESTTNSFTSDPNYRIPNTVSFRTNAIDNLYEPSSGPLKLKSSTSQFSVDSFSPPRPRLLYTGERTPLSNPPLFPPQYPLPRNFAPRLNHYVPPPKHFNNAMLQRPLHFVPHPFPRPVNNPNPVNISKQKVKFSDTVTHIVVPDFSKISIEDETLSSYHKSRNHRNPKASVVSSNFPKQGSNNRDLLNQQEHQEEEESNGRIKVIHFGVV